ncbi:MAG: nucleotidyltransferase domain-containing protein [Cyanobacteria bacterium]|nr:nucleotidyltransferase domain-containing protein [Cyanobacteriota bacterium]
MLPALKNASFVEELSGEGVPLVTQYRLGTDDEGFFAEFLTPLQGSGTKRSGLPDTTLAKAGITAQKLRHLDLLLVKPWSVRLSSPVGVPVREPVAINVANPVSFIAQKLLIQKHRKPNKQAQDALYLHDTLELFGGELGVLRKLWNEEVRPTMPDTTARSVDRLQRDCFGSISDVIRNAARIPQDRAVTPARMQAVCSFGLEEIFGE